MAGSGSYVWEESFTTTTDLSAKQFYAVKLSAAMTVAAVADDTDRAIGVLQNKPNAHVAEVLIQGISKMVVDGNAGAISAGSYLAVADDGKGVATTTPDATVIGVALEASSAAGDIIRVLVGAPVGFFRTAAS